MSRNRRGDSGFERSFYESFSSNPKNTQTFLVERMYLRLLSEWAMTRFKWINLPESIDPRFIEHELFMKSLVIFYHDKDVDAHLAVRGASWGPLNMYDNPTRFQTMSIGTYTGVQLVAEGEGVDCVPIWGTYSRIPSRDVVALYARRLAELDTSLVINAKAMRHNRIVTAPEGQRQTAVNMLRQIDEGQPSIYLTNDINANDMIQSLDISTSPGNLDALRQEKNQVWNEAMTMLGITNTNQDKKERLVAAEATGTDGQVLAARNSAWKPRMEACEKINRLFNLDISVEWDLAPEIMPQVGEEPEDVQGGEEVDNGNIHDGTA